MKRIFLAFLVAVPFLVQAQTVDEVLAKHTTAMGGLDHMKALKTVYMEGVSVGQNGNEVIQKIYKGCGKGYRREIDFGMGTMMMVANESGAWSTNPRSGGAFEAMPADAAKAMAETEMDCTGPLVDAVSKGHKAELIGKETINGAECHAVKLTLKSGRDITYYIDSKTGYVVRQKSKGGGMRRQGADPNQEYIVDFSDFRKVDGYVFPFTQTPQGMGGSLNYEKIEVNKTFDDTKFKAQ
jgi:outer membrane lipoprotein-sorting protein